MRKALKIKASVLCLAWLIIFMHGVIPHMHVHDLAGIESHSSDCSHGGLCSDNHDTDDSERGILSTSGHNHNEAVCHFNPNLFSQLSLDASFIFEHSSGFDIPVEPADLPITTSETRCNKPPLIKGRGLRAPPLA